jgi:DNA mismatch repair ATPase MutS
MGQAEASAPVFMCGFPKSGLDKYVGKLLRNGFAVAVCNQLKAENGVIRREVGEVLRCQ